MPGGAAHVTRRGDAAVTVLAYPPRMRVALRTAFLTVLLLVAGAAGCKRPSEALHEAAAEGDAEKVQAILAKQPDLVDHRADPLGRQPIHDAKTRRVAEVLLAAGARLDATDRAGRQPIHTARTAEVIDFFVERGVSIHTTWGPESRTVLHSAETAEAVNAFVRHGIPVDTKSFAGQTALFVNDSPDAIAALVQNGADPNARDHEGHRPIFFAKPARIKALVAAGADVNARDAIGATALHHAAFHGSDDQVRALVEAGADVNLRLPPHVAVTDAHSQVAFARLGGKTAMGIAKTTDIKKLLEKAGGTE